MTFSDSPYGVGTHFLMKSSLLTAVNRRIFFAGVLALSAFPMSSAWADCRSIPIAPSVRLDILTPPVNYTLNAATETLSARARENGTALGKGSRLLGLTVNQY